MKVRTIGYLTAVLFLISATAIAQEVPKGGIPAERLATSYGKLPWGVAVWDVPQAVEKLDNATNVIWIDTRPSSFFSKGTVRGAIDMPWDQKGSPNNKLTKEAVLKAATDKGVDPSKALFAFFCQGPECHRSYNASYIAVTDWGLAATQVIWFRAGYPHLIEAIKADSKLKRKVKRYLSDEALESL